MLQDWVILLASFAYLGLLFAIAWYGDKRADSGRSIIANPYIYALSLAVYATTWTFYGSVGRAAESGIGFLPIYLGPTLTAALWWLVLRKMIRISKANRITSIADFVASRYGKSQLLGGFVTVIAVVGVVPYIALQLKAVSNSYSVIRHYPDIVAPAKLATVPVFADTTLYIALLLAAFTVLFGTRHLDATERHEGMVAAIAFESLVKLVAFLAVGAFVTFGVYHGFADVFARAAAVPKLNALLTVGGGAGTFASWASLTVLSALSILFLPRQFQVAVVENVNETHVAKASWLLPLYLLAINIFVLPIAFGGILHFGGGEVNADSFVLALPMAEHQQGLALLVFIGGLSAATGMLIVETIALSTMVCNDLVMPLLMRLRALRLNERTDLSRLLLAIRRSAIVLILLLGYGYFRLAGNAYALVAIGLISFAAVAQFAPAMLGGMFWRGGTRSGALAGLLCGFAVWTYTLLLPSFAKSGWLPAAFIEHGPWGIELLRPLALFGLSGLDQITHALTWSLLANLGAYIGASVLTTQSTQEQAQAARFVDAFRPHAGAPHVWRGSASLPDLRSVLARYLSPARADELLTAYARQRGLGSAGSLVVDAQLVHFAESELAGAVGGPSARILIAAAVKEEELTLVELKGMLDEASQVIDYSHRLEQKSQQLEATTAELRAANARLQELDRLKDEFVSTVSHELRTPLTSIRAFSEILHDNPELPTDERSRFLAIIVKESERLTRLINQMLDLAKIESGTAEWNVSEIDVREVVDDSAAATGQLFGERGAKLDLRLPPALPAVRADRDRLMQVVINLLSNAVKFCDAKAGRVTVRLSATPAAVRVDIEDNGPGVKPEERELIFEKFRQGGDTLTEKPPGTGLGLPISRQIVGHFGGKLWVEDAPGGGARFSFTLPLQAA